MEEIKPIKLNSEDSPTVNLAGRKKPIKIKAKLALSILVLILLGVGSGYGLTQLAGSKTPKRLNQKVGEEIVKGDTFGVMDEDVFSDEAEGEMANGGIDGEGSHHLIREGGESQFVYLTSSVIDLDQFIGKKVKIWGQTFEAEKAGWLMDVGRLEIL